MFIHGMFMTPHAWDSWQPHFRACGYSTSAPPWPEHEGRPEALRRNPRNSALGRLTLEDVLQSYRALISALREKPVLIGHSMGGLVAQKLLSEGMAAAGIAINSAPPRGVFAFDWPFIRSNWPLLNPFAGAGLSAALTFEQFKYALANRLSPGQARVVYQDQIVPESRLVAKGVFSESAAVDFGASRGPLLMIAGGGDHLVPAALNLKNVACYAGSPSVTEFRLYEGRSHLTILEPGWRQLASYCVDWLDRRKLGALKAVSPSGSWVRLSGAAR